MRKGMKRISLDIPITLFNVLNEAAVKRFKTLEEHIRDILHSTYKIK